MKLLLIEDNSDIRLALSRALYVDYTVDTADTGELGMAKALAQDYGAIILDLNLPDVPGLAVCQQLRDCGLKAPILILTGESRVMSKISLLDAGADDYLTKPFSLGELKVRLRALLRRAGDNQLRQNRLVYDDLELNCAEHSVSRSGQPIKLRRKEFSLLECLMQNAGLVVSRQSLCDYAWRDTDDPWKNTVDVHIKYLRDKIDRPFPTRLIKTVHGLGYMLETPPVTRIKEIA